MKIALISTPKSVSTFTVDLLSSKLNLTNYEEFYNQILISNDDQNVIAANVKLYDQDDYIVKFMVGHLSTNTKINYNNINWQIFDKIIFTQRNNIADQIIINYLIREEIGGSIVEPPIHIPLDETFYSIKQHIINTNHQYETYKTELIQKFSDKCLTLVYENIHTQEYVNTLNSINEATFTGADNISHQHDYSMSNSLEQIIANYTEIYSSLPKYTKTQQ